MPDGQDEAQQVPIELQVPEHLVNGTYANYILVANTKYHYVLDFAVTPPTSDLKRGAEDITAFPARVVARILIPEGIIDGLIGALQSQKEKHQGAIDMIREITKEDGGTSLW